jgi:soluble lytic murein transglycosylase
MGTERHRGHPLRGGLVALAATAWLGSVPSPAARAETEPASDSFATLGFEPVPTLRAARTAFDAGELEKGAELLLPLDSTPLGDYSAWLRGEALAEAGDLEAAAEALEGALERKPPTELRAAIEAALGRIALSQEELADAYRHFQVAWDSARDSALAAELALEIGRAFEDRLLPGHAIGVYRTAWRNWPLSEGGEQAFERARWLERATDAKPPAPEAIFRLAEKRRRALRCASALGLYEEVLESEALESESREQARRGRAECLMAQRRYDDAVQAFTELLAEDPADTNLAIQLTRARGRGGHRTAAARELIAIARRSGGHVRARTRYLAALYLEDSDPERALELLRQVELQKGARGYARLARWRLAWADIRAGRPKRAEKRLEPLARGRISDIEVQRARYWLGKMQRARGDEAGGRKLLEQLVDAVPLSYYGLLAADVLGTPVEVERAFLGDRNGPPADLSLDRAGWLINGGFPDAARLEMYSRLHTGRLGREARLGLATLLHSVGDHYRAVRTVVDGFGDALEQGIDERWREAWELAWPRPFGELVHAAVGEFRGDPALVYAVMREESTFRPKVESPVGARGLMQIIPRTGDEIAEALGEEEFDSARLFVADTNVRFGTYYLKHLLGRFSHKQPFAIAAYNAGPEAVGRWVSRDGQGDFDIFVDSVPYGETRRYLRKVIRSFRVYRLLYEELAPPAVANPSQPKEAAVR